VILKLLNLKHTAPYYRRPQHSSNISVKSLKSRSDTDVKLCKFGRWRMFSASQRTRHLNVLQKYMKAVGQYKALVELRPYGMRKVQGCWEVLSPTRKETSYSDRRFWFSYILFIIIIWGILVLFIHMTRQASNELFSPSNKIHREVGRAKDLSAPL